MCILAFIIAGIVVYIGFYCFRVKWDKSEEKEQ